MDYATMNDESLAEECKTGDDGAFHELMSRHLKHIFNFARQYVRTDPDAEDITQDAFFKAWKYIRRFKKGSRFRPWLFAIARNTALDHIKKKKAVSFSSLDDAENDMAFADTLADEEPLPPEIFAKAELADLLMATMAGLHPDHRAVLIMRYHDGMKFDEIAEIMDKPMNTVKSWHRRSLHKIRDILHQDKPPVRI
jgi:RNA polymerase sigma-70 factor, ECF subfamily